MARLIRPLRSSISRPSSSSKILIPQLPSSLLAPEIPVSFKNALLVRTYISEMRKSAFEGNMLRLLRNEIQYELDRSPPNEVRTHLLHSLSVFGFHNYVKDEHGLYKIA